MALPSMPTTYTTSKNIYESAIVRRREMDAQQRQNFGAYDRYMQQQGVRAEKERSWTSEQAFKQSMQAYLASSERARKAEQLQSRRARLAQQLGAERDALERELRLSTRGEQAISERREEMRVRAEDIRSARSARDEVTARDKMVEHLHRNDPALREIQTKQHEKYVVGQWRDQIAQKEEELEEEIEREREHERMQAEQAKQAEEQEQVEIERRVRSEYERKQQLLVQMDTVRKKDAEAERMKQEERKIIEEQAQIERIEQERQRLAAERKKQEHGRILLRQHAAALRSKAKRIQEELAEDHALLERLGAEEGAAAAVEAHRKERARADADWMRGVIERQLELERQREAELDILFREESARLWAKREEEWRREREAREALMAQVLEERRSQLEARLAALRKQQLESFRDREQMLKELETARALDRSDERQDREARNKRKEEIASQVAERRSARAREDAQAAIEAAGEAEEQRAYERFLEQERQRLERIPFQPKVHSRPKVPWS